MGLREMSCSEVGEEHQRDLNKNLPREHMERMKVEYSAGDETGHGSEITEDQTNSSTPTKFSTCLLWLLLLSSNGKNNE